MTIHEILNAGNTITVNHSAVKNMIKTKIPDTTGKYNIIVSPLTVKIYNVILEKFKQNNFNPVSLHMNKSGDDVTITCCDATGLPFADGSKWFSITNAPCVGMSSDSLIEIAGMIADYDMYVEREKQAQKCLEDYYQEHIAGHSYDELDLGQRILAQLEPDISNKSRMTDNDIYRFSIKWSEPVEVIWDAVKLAEAWEVYSEKYKQIYTCWPTMICC